MYLRGALFLCVLIAIFKSSNSRERIYGTLSDLRCYQYNFCCDGASFPEEESCIKKTFNYENFSSLKNSLCHRDPDDLDDYRLVVSNDKAFVEKKDVSTITQQEKENYKKFKKCTQELLYYCEDVRLSDYPDCLGLPESSENKESQSIDTNDDAEPPTIDKEDDDNKPPTDDKEDDDNKPPTDDEEDDDNKPPTVDKENDDNKPPTDDKEDDDNKPDDNKPTTEDKEDDDRPNTDGDRGVDYTSTIKSCTQRVVEQCSDKCHKD